MFYYLLDFFYNLFNWVDTGNDEIGDMMSDFFNAQVKLNSNVFDVNNFSISFQGYCALLLALISEIIIVVLCCLFIYRLIRLVGRLFSGGAL